MKRNFTLFEEMVSHSERQRIEQYFSASKRPIIFGHISPDGDSIGSCLALYHYFKLSGITPWVAMSGHCPNTLKYLSDYEKILFVVGEEYPKELDRALREADLFISLDHNSIYRVGKVLADKVRSALTAKKRPYICIDHHEEPGDEFDYVLCRPQAAATCEILSLILCKAKEITPTIATCLLTGIITDTGLFNHSSAHPQLFEVVASLLRYGADKEAIVDHIFHRFSADRQKLEGYVLHEKMHILPQYKTAYFSLTLDEQRHFNVTPGDTEGLVNKPLNIDGIDIAAFFKETLHEGIKISLRSRANASVNDIASNAFGGGGHICAAGAEYEGTMQDAIAIFIDYLAKYRDTTNNA